MQHEITPYQRRISAGGSEPKATARRKDTFFLRATCLSKSCPKKRAGNCPSSVLLLLPSPSGSLEHETEEKNTRTKYNYYVQLLSTERTVTEAPPGLKRGPGRELTRSATAPVQRRPTRGPTRAAARVPAAIPADPVRGRSRSPHSELPSLGCSTTSGCTRARLIGEEAGEDVRP